MNKKQIESIESYFKTENQHWNGYALEMLSKELQQGNFENPETPLSLFDTAVNSFIENTNTPLQALNDFRAEVAKLNLVPRQKLFVYNTIYFYLKNTEFAEIDLHEVVTLLHGEIKKLKAEIIAIEFNKPFTGNIRDTLKDFIQKEIELLPGTMKELEPVQRLNILCKLIQYVLPKVESVTHNFGEPVTGKDF